MSDFQVISSFCITLLGAMLVITAYFEVEEADFELDEVEDDDKKSNAHAQNNLNL